MTNTMNDIFDELVLETLFLDECKVIRGDVDDATPGRVEPKIEVEFSHQSELVFTVRTSFRFLNVDDVLVAQIDASFVASYSYSGAELERHEIEKYAQGPLLRTAAPFIREFLASMTNRLALPPFYLPLFAHRGAVLRARAKSGAPKTADETAETDYVPPGPPRRDRPLRQASTGTPPKVDTRLRPPSFDR
jgi:hypothetical protein